MDKLLLVDGSNLLFQMFFGMPARIFNKKGKAIHGIIGFTGALLKIIRMTKPTHIAVFFDGAHANDRVALNPDYKANRPDYSQVPETENPFSQLAEIYSVLDCLNVRYAETTVCETDDWIAGYALTYGKDIPIVISSFDSDYFQLINDNVSVLRYRGDKTIICTPQYISDKFGIEPSQYADFKSLVGDTSDNIRGADKVGPKTAAQLIQKYGSLESVIANAQTIEKPSIRQSIIENADRLKTNYKLIKLTNDAVLPFELSELKYVLKSTSTNDILQKTGILP
ncbi:MAG: flap endonuclease [Clostridia bacterium]|nr:flap endonuclease [Clostridia bacterium]